MLRVIDNSDPNQLLTSLYFIILGTVDLEDQKIKNSLYNLAFKCTIRMTRNMKNIIEDINPTVVIDLIHSYIQTFNINSNSIGSKSIKTLLNELVIRSDYDYIWKCYD